MEALGQQVGSEMRSSCGDAQEAIKERIAYLEDQYAAVLGKVEATGKGLEKVSNAQNIAADSLTNAVTRFGEIVGEEKENRAVQHKEVEKRFEGIREYITQLNDEMANGLVSLRAKLEDAVA